MPRIHSPLLTQHNNTIRVEISIDSYLLWYEIPNNFFNGNIADSALCASLIPSMFKGEDIIIDDDLHVSECLYARLKEFQIIFSHWFPAQFRPVNIIAKTKPSTYLSSASHGSFFSGGVDSLYTLVSQPDISHMIFIHGIDMQLENIEQFEQVKKANEEIAAHYAKNLITVISNVRQYITSHGFSWSYGQGGGLSSVAHLLGLTRVYIPASDSYLALHSLGSHPVIDSMWSTERCDFIHHGMLRRSDKTRIIAQDQFATDRLRVCWMDNGYNCGTCFKCLRTMTTLNLLGIKSKAFPELDTQKLKSVPLYQESEIQYLEENLELATKNNRKEFIRIIEKRLFEMNTKRKLRKIKRLLS